MATDGGLRSRPTREFARNLKWAAKRGRDLTKLRAIIEDLWHRRPLQARNRDHPLKGQWKGSRECHIEPDWLLLIYEIDDEAGELILVRTGSHADLFGL